MKLLALFTAGEPASVAVLADGSGDAAPLASGRTSEELVPRARELLTRAGLEPAELDGVCIAEGPGSFTGLRVGASTALGLARATGIPLYGAGTLLVWASLALRADARTAGCAVVLDARRGEIFLG
ncbi:MAG: tRNA (adenosine(37)-N6)-threonylcarbamoyltransferase complex dimerization subunit type 1 TsaB, partial [Gemmatimonadetes bacterium]|nr:tRNA (adenosine(37)-N6)-threonylcarbamoyltransferase complex dimerization subunit type 1 TsaB [Gemmatimonadota bacterium]